MTVEFDTSSEVELESRATVTNAIELRDASKLEPGTGIKTATSCSGEVAAANDVSQVTIELEDDPATGTSEHPPIAAPARSKTTTPLGTTRRADEVTLAINATDAFVATAPGDTVNTTLLGLGTCLSVVNADT